MHVNAQFRRLKMARKNQWVVRRDDGWAVRGEGNRKDTSHHNTQREAIIAARGIAQNQRSGMFIQNLHGRIRERNTYGNVLH
jgi:hypothetical protein